LFAVATTPLSFKDHFSEKSAQYANYRPQYPAELFQFLVDQCHRHELAWDCATGNGQAAVALGEFFESVIATDASDTQIDCAMPQTNVSYRVATAEASGLDDASVDVLTVGQALHWFDREKFYAEAGRVLAPGGLLAAWCYGLCHVTDECDGVVDELYSDIVNEFWPPERRLIEERYAGIAMPAAEIEVPRFNMCADWAVDDMLGYLRTWSACSHYQKAHAHDPVSLIAGKLHDAWGTGSRPVRWPLTLKICRF
jgi:SAM-dependent methyltransferase